MQTAQDCEKPVKGIDRTQGLKKILILIFLTIALKVMESLFLIPSSSNPPSNSWWRLLESLHRKKRSYMATIRTQAGFSPPSICLSVC